MDQKASGRAQSGDATLRRPSSRYPGFYEMPISDRQQLVREFVGSMEDSAAGDLDALHDFGSLGREKVDVFIENGIGTFPLPLGVATNFRINGRDYLIPMAVEETSVLAAASHGAKLARAGGGFEASASEPIMTGQVQLFVDQARPEHHAALEAQKAAFLAYVNCGYERLLARGGGAKDMDWRWVPELTCWVVHLHVHTGDAMGANIVNTMCERLGLVLSEVLGGRVGLRILTNLNTRRLAYAECHIPFSTLDAATHSGLRGSDVAEKVVAAYAFAHHDPYRAATHNKGVMNGIDPVLIATGNDWRAVEAGAHAYAARSGSYRPLTHWSLVGDRLRGQIELPMAVGTVGGVTRLHPSAQAAMRLLGAPSARVLAAIVASVGLAQNLSALKALSSEGIQRGHMSLHQKNLDLLRRQGASRA